MELTAEADLLVGFEACTLSDLPHRDHVHVAWVYLAHHPFAVAERLMADGLRRFALSKGAPHKYHETMTRAWMRLVADARLRHASFAAMVGAHPELLDSRALSRFYSAERLARDEARLGWVEPDLAPLPPCPFD
jgi:hypothetical protein